MSETLIRWKLNEVMARHRVLGKDLASFLGISTNAISALRKAEIMPEIGGDRWEQICVGINSLSKIGEVVTPLDLIEYIPQKEPLATAVPEITQPKSGGNKGKRSTSRQSSNTDSQVWIVPSKEVA